MGLLRNLIVGRPDGIRAKLLGRSGAVAAPGAEPSPRPQPRAPDATFVPAEKALRLKMEPPRDVNPPEGYEVVLHKDALEAGQIIEIIIGGTAIAVANVGGQFHAISNTCAHAEGPLGEGSLDGAVVACPYHGWQYDVRDGSCLTNPQVKVASYPVQVVGAAVCVKL